MYILVIFLYIDSVILIKKAAITPDFYKTKFITYVGAMAR